MVTPFQPETGPLSEQLLMVMVHLDSTTSFAHSVPHHQVQLKPKLERACCMASKVECLVLKHCQPISACILLLGICAIQIIQTVHPSKVDKTAEHRLDKQRFRVGLRMHALHKHQPQIRKLACQMKLAQRLKPGVYHAHVEWHCLQMRRQDSLHSCFGFAEPCKQRFFIHTGRNAWRKGLVLCSQIGSMVICCAAPPSDCRSRVWNKNPNLSEQRAGHCPQMGCSSFAIALSGSAPYSSEHEISTAVAAAALADSGVTWSCGGGGEGEEGLFISSGECEGISCLAA